MQVVPSKYRTSLHILFLLLSSLSCAADSPVSPTSTTAGEQLTMQEWTMQGQVVSNPHGTPVAGAAIKFLPSLADQEEPVHANSDGRWHVSGSGPMPYISFFVVSAAGHIERQARLRGQNISDIVIDLIADEPPFSLNFYRQLVRNGYEGSQLEPIQRWEAAPSFYIKTTDERGEHVPQDEIDEIISLIRLGVPQATGGYFNAGAIETGPSERPSATDWINVIITSPQTELGGSASLGRNPGVINYSRASNCKFGKQGLFPSLFIHELGHAMGFWHVAPSWNDNWKPGAGAVKMGGSRHAIDGCTEPVDFSEMEQFHAAIMYSRPAGNVDPDADP